MAAGAAAGALGTLRGGWEEGRVGGVGGWGEERAERVCFRMGMPAAFASFCPFGGTADGGAMAIPVGVQYHALGCLLITPLTPSTRTPSPPPTHTRTHTQDLLTEALSRPWTARQSSVLAQLNNAETVIDAVQRVDAAAAGAGARGPGAAAAGSAVERDPAACDSPQRAQRHGGRGGGQQGAGGAWAFGQLEGPEGGEELGSPVRSQPPSPAAAAAAPRLPPPPTSKAAKVDWDWAAGWQTPPTPQLKSLVDLAGGAARIEPDFGEHLQLDEEFSRVLSSYSSQSNGASLSSPHAAGPAAGAGAAGEGGAGEAGPQPGLTGGTGGQWRWWEGGEDAASAGQYPEGSGGRHVPASPFQADGTEHSWSAGVTEDQARSARSAGSAGATFSSDFGGFQSAAAPEEAAPLPPLPLFGGRETGGGALAGRSASLVGAIISQIPKSSEGLASEASAVDSASSTDVLLHVRRSISGLPLSPARELQQGSAVERAAHLQQAHLHDFMQSASKELN